MPHVVSEDGVVALREAWSSKKTAPISMVKTAGRSEVRA